MRTTRLIRPLTAAVLLASFGCGRGAPAEFTDDVPEAERYGGTAVIASISDIPDVNPLTSTETLAAEVTQFILFLPVIQYDDDFRPIPGLARSWEVDADTTLLTFHLRDDVYWHDGVRTTAYDLKLAYDLARHPETGFPNASFWTHYGEGTVVDSFTFQVELRPHAEFMDPWRTFTAVPRHILGEVPPSQLSQHPFSHHAPVGNGPFRFVSRVDGQSWTFEANPDFPEELGGRPYLDRLVYRVVPEPTTLLTELITGRIDFYPAIPPEQASRVLADPNLRLIHYPDRAFVLIGWNQRRPPFDDVRVRRALTMALDRGAIVDAVLYGYGALANATVPPFFWQYDLEAGADLGYDPEAARALLAEAGWTPGPDGILRNAAGQPFQFTLSTNLGNQARADIAQIIEAQLRQVGIQVRIQILEWGTLLDRINTPTLRDFDAVLIGWRTEFRIDDTDLFHCDRRDQPFQWVGHCDPRLDSLLDTLPLIVDRDEALPLWREYQRLIAEQQPYTFIYFQERVHAAHNRLRNVRPDPRGDWYGVAKWWIAPGQRTAR
ncbi:MAG TPA: ABC transporter substrate-binding protein [Longimicrobiales bacterium]|nr:ABC transporter substrate-binding protein [Longimicrobiales bacterium]